MNFRFLLEFFLQYKKNFRFIFCVNFRLYKRKLRKSFFVTTSQSVTQKKEENKKIYY